MSPDPGGPTPRPTLRRIDISDKVSPAIQQDLIRRQFLVSMAAITLGAACILAGVLLTAFGLTGAIGWSFSAFGIQSKLVDAGPGVFLCVVGILIIALNGFSVNIRR